MVLRNSSLPNSALVITDASIKNIIATSISHIHSANWPLIKTVHHTSFVTSMEAELFAIRCSINQACSIENVSKIIIVMNSIHVAKKIFNSESHPFQIHTSAILSELQKFFNSNDANSIEFWEWKITFQVSEGKGNHFFDLLDDDLNSIEPSYIKGGLWLQMFGHSNLLCARATRAISNHAPIGEYRL